MVVYEYDLETSLGLVIIKTNIAHSEIGLAAWIALHRAEVGSLLGIGPDVELSLFQIAFEGEGLLDPSAAPHPL